MTDKHEKMLAFLAAAAEAGRPCPTSIILERALGLGESRVNTILGHLGDAGLIRIERHPMNKNRRRILVVADMARTDWTPPKMGNVPIDDASDLLEDADAYMARVMRGRRYEDVRVVAPLGRRLYGTDAIQPISWSSAA